ncbi:hypothetical protein E4T52_08923 [Aureobasidium sp. EXF-3400]|nr:hypothetical protein E4T51_08176 [Aureobasidium sp. EXF-12344]KAI4776110.1 hypothetical protein E4T52_08923 [Aureobasidium sp. EXF-3400]
MARRSRHEAVLPTPPNEENYTYLTVEQPSRGETASKQVEEEGCSPDQSPTNWKKDIEDAIDAETDQLIEFLDDFSTAARSSIQNLTGGECWDGYATTAPVADVISSFLSSRQTKNVALGSPTFPSVVSVFDEGEGPCLVLNGLLSPRLTSPSHPYSFNKTAGPSLNSLPMSAHAAGTAAIVAAYAYLHSIRHHLFGTIVLAAISDTEEGHLGTCRHLLHTDERRSLWRGDCMITAVATSNAIQPTPSSPDSFSSRPATKTIDPATFDLESSCWQRNSLIKDFTPSRLSTPCATHPVATSLSNNGKRVLGRRPSIPDFQTGRQLGSHTRFWTEVGVSSFCLGVGGVESSETAASPSPQTQSPQDLMDQDVTCKEMVDSGIHDVVMDDDQGSEDGNVEEINRKQWIQLVKVLVLTAWDQVGLES